METARAIVGNLIPANVDFSMPLFLLRSLWDFFGTTEALIGTLIVGFLWIGYLLVRPESGVRPITVKTIQRMIGMNLAGLWSTDQWIDFQVEITSLATSPITFDGIVGQISCDGEVCQAAPKWVSPPKKLKVLGETADVVIRQPIAHDMADRAKTKLMGDNRRLTFDLASLVITGSTASCTPVRSYYDERYGGHGQGSRFVAHGPIEGVEDAGLFRVWPTYVSEGHYVDDGRRKSATVE